MKAIEQTLDSREVARMVEKDHAKLLRDIRIYVSQLGEAKIGFTDFFKESIYMTGQNKTLPCYQITKKGCEFIAHKLTGTKGTIFTARYINRFHEMQDIISEQAPELPWFVRKFQGGYIVLERDFITITGVDIKKHKLFFRPEYFKGGLDWNGHGWKCNKEEFKKKHGFDYGDDDCMIFFYPCGVVKALKILADDRKVQMNPEACEMLLEGLRMIEKPKQTVVTAPKPVTISGALGNELPIQINIVVRDSRAVI